MPVAEQRSARADQVVIVERVHHPRARGARPRPDHRRQLDHRMRVDDVGAEPRDGATEIVRGAAADQLAQLVGGAHGARAGEDLLHPQEIAAGLRQRRHAVPRTIGRGLARQIGRAHRVARRRLPLGQHRDDLFRAADDVRRIDRADVEDAHGGQLRRKRAAASAVSAMYRSPYSRDGSISDASCHSLDEVTTAQSAPWRIAASHKARYVAPS